ncbi:hypothetical protein JCM3263A_21200 [Thermobifida fusca]|jgi:hypothetical protein|uniref:Subtilisin inhibitor domain-containing protein n=1 Tax=Thermobifida fusca TM51 TaxID=1169414 RepID=A0A9P2TCP5_THEFU|nr:MULTISPECIES: SSI family serine proteinase inhibitor [Thermobifida]EOR72804.1 hypothetical protein TM51_00040 [Thermobifida fusca TM51]MBO2530139.1 hypothetical protein [Thermobifida sp.]PPS95016.1 hypothetical protein BH05_04525 [Thermobifida fusca]PZN61103.1 MAG: hypothetical protein DIU53_13845 [Thermobifida fusca]QOS59515.1 hypothetical protein IM867_03615 [Thermobifida fusca]
MRRLVTAAVGIPVTAVCILLCGCSPATDTSPPATTPGVSPQPQTELTIERFSAVEDSPTPRAEPSPDVWTLTCGPAGGTHPDPAAACAALDRAGTDVFEPVPADQPCILVYGGPETATVRGRIDHTDVNAEFSRTNGCEIARWEQLAPLLDP